MPGCSFEEELRTGVPHDRRDDPEGSIPVGEPQALLNVELEERVRQHPARSHERAASDAADFLPAEDDDGARADTLDRFDRGNDAQRAVEPTAVRDRVEV